MRSLSLLIPLWGACLLASCATPPGGFDSPVPQERLKAIAKAAREGDKSAAPNIVPFLSSDDPAVRMAAIRALESLTGQTLGYDHAGSEAMRQEAIERWVHWCNLQRTANDAEHENGMQKIR